MKDFSTYIKENFIYILVLPTILVRLLLAKDTPLNI